MQILMWKASSFLKKITEECVDNAKTLCPVDTGKLRDSITILSESAEKCVYGSNVEYSLYVEIGTKNMAAQPYLRPSLDLTKGQNT